MYTVMEGKMIRGKIRKGEESGGFDGHCHGL